MKGLEDKRTIQLQVQGFLWCFGGRGGGAVQKENGDDREEKVWLGQYLGDGWVAQKVVSFSTGPEQCPPWTKDTLQKSCLSSP